MYRWVALTALAGCALAPDRPLIGDDELGMLQGTWLLASYLVEGKDETATYYVPFISKWRIQGKTLFDELTLDDQVRYSLEIDAKKSPKQLVATRPLVDGPQVWVYEYEVSSQKLTIIEVPKPYVPTRGKSVTVFMREK